MVLSVFRFRWRTFLRVEDMELFIAVSLYHLNFNVLCYPPTTKQHQNTSSNQISNYQTNTNPKKNPHLPETLAIFCWTSLGPYPTLKLAPRNVLQKDPRPGRGTILQIRSLDLKKAPLGCFQPKPIGLGP